MNGFKSVALCIKLCQFNRQFLFCRNGCRRRVGWARTTLPCATDMLRLRIHSGTNSAMGSAARLRPNERWLRTAFAVPTNTLPNRKMSNSPNVGFLSRCAGQDGAAIGVANSGLRQV